MSKLSAAFDPTGHWAEKFDDKGEMKQWLFEACGLIPSFYYEIQGDLIPHETSPEGVMQLLMGVYGFGTDIRMEGEIDDAGVYKYPQDPDLHPYLEIKGLGHSVYIYPYGIVGVVDRTGGLSDSIARLD